MCPLHFAFQPCGRVTGWPRWPRRPSPRRPARAAVSSAAASAPAFAYSPIALAAGIGPRLAHAAGCRQSSELRTSLPPTRARTSARRLQPWRGRWRADRGAAARLQRAWPIVCGPLFSAHCLPSIVRGEPRQAVDPGTAADQICRRRHPPPLRAGRPIAPASPPARLLSVTSHARVDRHTMARALGKAWSPK